MRYYAKEAAAIAALAMVASLLSFSFALAKTKDNNCSIDQNQPVTGKVVSKNDNSIAVSRGEKIFTVNISDTTQIVGGNRNDKGNKKEMSIKDVNVKDRVMIMGSQHKDAVDACRIVDVSH